MYPVRGHVHAGQCSWSTVGTYYEGCLGNRTLLRVDNSLSVVEFPWGAWEAGSPDMARTRQVVQPSDCPALMRNCTLKGAARRDGCSAPRIRQCMHVGAVQTLCECVRQREACGRAVQCCGVPHVMPCHVMDVGWTWLHDILSLHARPLASSLTLQLRAHLLLCERTLLREDVASTGSARKGHNCHGMAFRQFEDQRPSPMHACAACTTWMRRHARM